MAQAADEATARCPLCGEEINLDVAYWKVSPKWRDMLAHRNIWALTSIEFRERQSIADAARRIGVPPELAARVLDFLYADLCGCRAAICVSCLDDYRSEL